MTSTAHDSTTTITEDKFEAQVVDGNHAAPDAGNFCRFTVPTTLQVTAGTKAEALDALDFDWHLHHPWGC